MRRILHPPWDHQRDARRLSPTRPPGELRGGRPGGSLRRPPKANSYHLTSGRRATTHWASLDRLAGLDATITVLSDRRVVDDVIITSAGVSAGIDMAFTVVAGYCGPEVAAETARYIEYPFWTG